MSEVLHADSVSVRYVLTCDYARVTEIAVLGDSESINDIEDLRVFVRQPGAICVVLAAGDGIVVGFMLYLVLERGIDILELVIHPNYRHCDYGSQLIGRVVRKLGPRYLNIGMVVRERDDASITLFRACGFIATGVRRRAFKDQDGYVFICRSSGHEQ